MRAYASAGAALGLALWVRANFGDPSIDQILYHLHDSEGAAIQMSGIFVFSVVMEVLLMPIVFALPAAAVHLRVVRARPAVRRIARALPPLSIAVGVAALLAEFSAFSYAASFLEPDHFDFFPTLVELAGFRVDGDRLGLGYSAIGTPEAARPEQRPSVSLLGLNGSASYRALWSSGS